MGITKDSKIIIVGAGVFGLSTAYHLVKDGYKNIEIFDKNDLEKSRYNPLHHTDSASADINKFYRIYNDGSNKYGKLSAKALQTWLKWSNDLRNLSDGDKAKLWDTDYELIRHTTGLRIGDQNEVGPVEKLNISGLKELGLDGTQFDVSSPERRLSAKLLGLSKGLEVIEDWKSRGIVPQVSGYIDGVGRMIKADKACYLVKLFLEKHGVVFHFGEEGTFKSLVKGKCSKRGSKAEGIVTTDGKEHRSDLVVAAAGPWTASLVPELNHRIQASLANIVYFIIPKDRQDLIDKYSQYPHIQWKTTSSEFDQIHGHAPLEGGFAFFPPSRKEGILKLNLRQRRYRNPVKFNGQYVSVPVTFGNDRLPKSVIKEAKDTILAIAPDVAKAKGLKIVSKLLWYTDAINSDFVLDYVPSVTNLLVATGGSSHGFKFLPVLGETIVDRLNNVHNEYTELFRWKNPSDITKDNYGLTDDLSKITNTFKDITVADDSDFVFSPEDLAKIGQVKLN